MYNTFDNRRVNIRMKKSKLNKKLDKIKSIKSSKRGIHMSSLMDSYDAVSFSMDLSFCTRVSSSAHTGRCITEHVLFVAGASFCNHFSGRDSNRLLTDRIGYKRSLVLSQSLLLLARSLLFVSFLCKNPVLFAIEAAVEGLSYCFSSGTDSA